VGPVGDFLELRIGLRILKRRFTSQVAVELKCQALGSMVVKVGDFCWVPTSGASI